MARPPATPLHVLIVDDDASVREALAAALTPEYVVHGAASSAEAFALLSRRAVAAIVLDAILVGEQGLDAVPRLRELSSAPVFLLTGHSNEDLAIRAVWARVEGYLKKPISGAELRAALARRLPAPGDAELAARARGVLDTYPPKPLRATELASQLGVTEGHLRRVFRQAFGRTPRQYLSEVRVRRAAHLLQTTRRGIKEVALDVGFANLAVFRRVFKRTLGCTPTALSARGSRQPPTDDGMSKT